MRKRLTLAFVGLALVILTLAGVVRAFTIADVTRDSELDHLIFDTRVLAHVVEDSRLAGELDPAMLAHLVRAGTQVTIQSPVADGLVVEGSGFDAGDLGDALRATETVGETTVTAVQSGRIVNALIRDKVGSLAFLILSLLGLAAVVGFVLSQRLSRPFTHLADGAAALGRGRFDLDLPQSRVPEVAAIADALRGSAERLEESIRLDREVLQHASHVVRTPLTAMRLELEQLTLRDDLDEDVRDTVARCVAEVQKSDRTVTELLDFARGRSLVAGAEVTLEELGSAVAERWREALPDSRAVTASVEAGGGLMLTPGPVEQLLDAVLRAVVRRGSGPVALRFSGHDEHLRVTVSGADGAPEDEAVQTIAGVLGGRVRSDADGSLEVFLPRR